IGRAAWHRETVRRCHPHARRALSTLLVAAATLAVAAPAEAARVSGSDRQEINAVLDQFVRHAVLRNQPEKAWGLVTSTLRGGTSRRDWARGNLPVYPYPAGGRTFHFAGVI